MSFTHLQIRSGYSFHESTNSIEKLVKRASELQFRSLALTDKDVLYGVLSFYQTCKKYGIKPIIGMSISVLQNESEDGECILLAKNEQGYKQLVKLSTDINVHNRKSLSIEQLSEYNDQLICILPANNNHLRSLLYEKSFRDIDQYLAPWFETYQRNLYIGLHSHGETGEDIIHEHMKIYHELTNVPVVAINDVRYLYENDDEALACLQSIKDGNRFLAQNNKTMKNRHLRSEQEMKGAFSEWPEAIETTTEIARQCQFNFDFERQLLPSYPVPNDEDSSAYLEKLCLDLVNERYDHMTEEIKDRLNKELSIIKSMNFSDYFLIVWDFVKYAKNNNILVGPGRGSAAGSIVAYILGITNVDPIKYELLFERFLNPERLSMPDIDIDFSDHRRDEIIQYVRTKYGIDHVAQIITFGTYAARSLLRELIKAMGIDQRDAFFILKQIPVQAHRPISYYVNENEELKVYIQQSDKLQQLIEMAEKLEGLPRHISTHAAGIVISDTPLINHVPLTFGTTETYLTQFSMNDLESIGLLKIDLLGLRNLTLLERILTSIAARTNRNINLEKLPSHDEKTFSLLQKGKTNGVFQLESTGMKQVLIKLKPTTFEDIVAVNALYRPGPMQFIDTYIRRKNKQEQVTYIHPDLELILNKTYGVLIYQEQIIQIANKMAGFSLGEADLLRRAVSKKQAHLMEAQRDHFIKGAMDRGYDQKTAEQVFLWIVKFSNYGFNRSHSVSYSKISYQLAYLKAHYPLHFFKELLNSMINQQEKVASYIREAKLENIKIMPPSINQSYAYYSIEGESIRMGLLSIKGIGHQTIKEIIQVRKEKPFKNLFDFCQRISLKVVKRNVIESLILAGAFDQTYSNRASLLASIDQAIDQGELFGVNQQQSSFLQEQLGLKHVYANIEDFTQMKKLKDEKELTGIYLSSHPLESVRTDLQIQGFLPLVKSVHYIGKKNVKACVIIQKIRVIRTKHGDQMAFLTFSDETIEMEGVIFPNVYQQARTMLNEEMVVFISGSIELRNNHPQWIINEIKPFNLEKVKNKLFIKLTEDKADHALHTIRNIALKYSGETPIIVYMEKTKKTYKLTNKYFVDPTDECLSEFKQEFGEHNVVLQTNEEE